MLKKCKCEPGDERSSDWADDARSSQVAAVAVGIQAAVAEKVKRSFKKNLFSSLLKTV